MIPGTDNRKMSKSYENTINIFDDPKAIEKKCKRLVTDSRRPEEPGDPARLGEFALFALFRAFAAPSEWDDVEGRYRAGGIGYGEIKARLAELIIGLVRRARERRADWSPIPIGSLEVRRAAADRARRRPGSVLDRARAACGVG